MKSAIDWGNAVHPWGIKQMVAPAAMAAKMSNMERSKCRGACEERMSPLSISKVVWAQSTNEQAAR